MKFRIAAVSFLNTIPLVDSLRYRNDELNEVRFDLPSRLGELLLSAQADVALLPVVEAFRGAAAGILPGTGIACRGAVDSVRFFFAGSMRDVSSVLVDRGSRTSVALLRILLQEVYDLQPEFHEVEPGPDVRTSGSQGVLVIGDRCFEYDRARREARDASVHSLDLGQAWWDLTGLPFVFAIWAVSSDFRARASRGDVVALAQLLTWARDDGLARLEGIAAREAAAGKRGHKGEATPKAIAYYFQQSLCYRLGDEEMAGLARFHELCIKHGIVLEGPFPEILRG